MARFQVESILADPELSHEIDHRLLSGGHRAAAIILRPGETTVGPASALGHETPQATGKRPRRGTVPRTLPERVDSDFGAEAIVLRFGRPSLLVRNDTFEVPVADTWKARLWPTKAKLERAILSVGRVEVSTLGTPFVGTAWMIAPDIAITNRHVADVFALRVAESEFAFRITPDGSPYDGALDFHEEVGSTTPFEVDLAQVLYIAADGNDQPDVALVRVRPKRGERLPPPIPLFGGVPTLRQTVVAVGYPAEDPRNDASDQRRIFGSSFDVKRLAPGEITGLFDNDVFGHDCTTLGGSSGSVILDVSTGAAVGLHFAGVYRKSNYAVSASVLRTLLERLGQAPEIVSAGSAQAVEEQAAKVDKAELANRRGFDSAFLGGDDPATRVSLPILRTTRRKEAVIVARSARGTARYALKYEHFSVVMHRARRMAIFTAVNIDGSQARRLKRESDPWAKDPRIPAERQIGGELYLDNQLDRGHLVRRIDPTWGDTAALAERDTFFFTNCSPQHARFNQSLWADLEDYLLDSADTMGFRASVFTGPIFSPTDGTYRGVRLPSAYWKVAAMLRTEDGKLSATGYIVSQVDLLGDLEFAYGACKTYQVTVAEVEKRSGLDFGNLTDADPLARQEGATSIRELASPRDLRLT